MWILAHRKANSDGVLISEEPGKPVLTFLSACDPLLRELTQPINKMSPKTNPKTKAMDLYLNRDGMALLTYWEVYKMLFKRFLFFLNLMSRCHERCPLPGQYAAEVGAFAPAWATGHTDLRMGLVLLSNTHHVKLWGWATRRGLNWLAMHLCSVGHSLKNKSDIKGSIFFPWFPKTHFFYYTKVFSRSLTDRCHFSIQLGLFFLCEYCKPPSPWAQYSQS